MALGIHRVAMTVSNLSQCTQGYYCKGYVGYQQPNDPDLINHLKNMTKVRNELELVHDFVVAYDFGSKRVIIYVIAKTRE